MIKLNVLKVVSGMLMLPVELELTPQHDIHTETSTTQVQHVEFDGRMFRLHQPRGSVCSFVSTEQDAGPVRFAGV